MKNYWQQKIKKMPKHILIFAGIILIGIFLRTYHFHDLLRFNADQARDASITSSVVDGKMPLPLLGPKAGGTEFKLGPAFYYFQIVSAEIFGNSPDKMAYPDLLFSILTIPLLYFLLRIYFDKKTTFSLVAIFCVSVFAIKYSRFAWNPNSTPFWSILFLYATIKIASLEKQSWKWAAILGVAIGIGIQLHTLLLALMPTVTVIVLAYLVFKKKNIWKTVLIVIAVAIFLNIPQIVSEYQNKGENVKSFFKGVKTKNEKTPLLVNIFHDTVCYAQGNTYAISGVNISDTCETKSLQNFHGGILSLFGLIIFLGGMAAGLRKLKQEKNQEKKSFLAIMLLYISLSFVVLIPLASEISMRFFLILAGVPFVLLGLCYEYILEKNNNKKFFVTAGVILGIVLISNTVIASQDLISQLKYAEEPGGSFDNVSLQEIELLSSFIVSHAASQSVVLDGSPTYRSRIIRPIQYMTEKSNVNVLDQKTNLADNMIFYVGNSKGKNKILKENNVQDYKVFGRMAIYQIGGK